MTIKDELQGVLDLQPRWTARRTPEMERRGEIIRVGLPSALLEHEPALQAAMAPFGQELAVQGKDQQGNYSEIPWTRLCSSIRSPNARTGWYLAYLFEALGDRCYLVLGHASTRFTRREFESLPAGELSLLVGWARNLLNQRFSLRPDLVQRIELSARRSNLGAAYASSTAYAVEYRAGHIPEDTELVSDLVYMLGLLSALYASEEERDDRQVDLPAEILDALDSAEIAAGHRPVSRKGQGRRQSAAERKAVENRAVELAQKYLEDQGYQLEYVGATESFDIKASRGTESLHVEVKGTTSAGDQVILTSNEVALHQRVHPNNALIIVHSISLTGKDEDCSASGGVLRCISPWSIEENRLSPISYRYEV